MGRLLAAAAALAMAAFAASPAAADCGPAAGDPLFLVGAQRRCVQDAPSLPPLRLGAELGVGALSSKQRRLRRAAVAFAVPADLRLIGPLWTGARLQYVTAAGAKEAAEGRARLVAATAGPRLVIDTEPARREAWRLEGGAGYVRRIGGGGSGALVEAAVTRQAGVLLVDSEPGVVPSHGRGHELALTLRAQQGLGAASGYRALFVSAGYATELGVPLPDGNAPPRGEPGVAHTFGVELGLGSNVRQDSGLASHLGLELGLPIASLLVVEARADVLRLASIAGGNVHQYGVLMGVRIPRWFPGYIELMGGYAVAMGRPPAGFSSGVVADIGFGAQSPNLIGCGLGLHVGTRTRIGLSDDNGSLLAVLATAGFDYDSSIRSRTCHP